MLLTEAQLRYKVFEKVRTMLNEGSWGYEPDDSDSFGDHDSNLKDDIAEMVYDEYVEWITFNHLSTSSAYIEIKQDKIVNLVHSLTQNPAFHTKEFEDQLREDTKQSIEKLVQIRGVYK